jgi:NADH:ubiquinone oxidoreductase subunit F (NADH-binding)
VIVDGLLVEPGSTLLANLDDGPGWSAHRQRHGPLPRPTADALLAAAEATDLRGRGGAAFPFTAKLRAVLERSRRRPIVVVNLSEGEPLSAKDHALAVVGPHLVLDGALAAAHALAAREVHLALPGEHPGARRAVLSALAERDDAEGVRCHVAAPRFVSGQSQAVVELVSGRVNLPVTAWQPAAIAGVKGRPTLLCNAETWAHLGLVLRGGKARTTLLTITAPDRLPRVREAAYGTRFGHAVPELDCDDVHLVLLGGFHGTWVRREVLARTPLSVDRLRAICAPLGPGIVHLPRAGECPVTRTAAIVEFLAGESARRCGPCRFGLPSLAAATQRLAAGTAESAEVERLATMVDARGACAHPDGTVRLIRSVLIAANEEVARHARGLCAYEAWPYAPRPERRWRQ